jgi:magnesium-dependent phosphatase-1
MFLSSFTTLPVETSYPNLFDGPKPSIIVFDCDWTLYPFDCHSIVFPPFKQSEIGIIDRDGRWADPFLQVPKILGAIVDAEIPIAFLSRNPCADSVESLLRVIPLYSAKGTMSLWDAMPSRDYFQAFSNNHFAALEAISGIDRGKMLFFDNNPENIAAAQKDMTAIEVGKYGMTWAALHEGITTWRQKLKVAQPLQSTYGQLQRSQEKGR